MDPIGSSCFSLNIEENQRKILEEKQRDEKFQEIIVSCGSLSKYEARNSKTLLPQIFAAAVASLYHMAIGISLAYSAILLPQLKNDTSVDFELTESKQSWIASIIVISVPIGSPIGGYLMDTIGRLNTVKLAAIPGIVGWVLIAYATNLPMMLTGRVILGFSSALGSGPAIVYLTEIARADMRGSLISLAPAYTSVGMVIAYGLGWFLDWRQVAWVSLIFVVIPSTLLFLIPDSPAWLVSRGRNKEALSSLNWINKYQPQPENKAQTLSEMQLNLLQKDHIKKLEAEALTGTGIAQKAKLFLKPTGYKPLLILIGLFFFQQFSGIYIMLFYSIQFFKEVGSDVNPYLASVLLGTLRCFMSMVNTYMLRTYRRRPLIVWSAFGMSICMLVSGLFTMWIKQNKTDMTWVPLAALAMYVVTSMIGLLSIPWTMTAELFPLEIRGMAHSTINGIANLLMFCSIQSYYFLCDAFGGVAGVQFFFAVVSLLGLTYAYVFLPETHNKKLKQIEGYFVDNTIYLGQTKKAKATNKTRSHRNATSDIVRNGDAQNQKLLNNKTTGS